MNDPKKQRSPSEFAQTLGEQQRSGDRRVLGLGPPPTPSEIGIAPPSPLQVQSVFDTRPMAGFDFAFDGVLTIDGGEGLPTDTVDIAVPDGFTAILRTVELEAHAGYLAPASGVLELVLTRSGATIPYNTVRFRASINTYTWHTHQVFGFWESFGVRISGAMIPNAANTFTARFFGVLVPSRSLPASDEVGSDPVLVRVYQQQTAGAR